MQTAPTTPLIVTVRQAARITGIPLSALEKSFMDPSKRPAYAPPPPPHFRRGRAINIYTALLPGWLEGLSQSTIATGARRRRGRPTKAEQLARISR